MGDKNSYPLALLLTAVDRISSPLARIQSRIDKVTKPVKQASNALSSLGQTAGLERLRTAGNGVGTALGHVGEESYRLGKRVTIGLAAAAFAGYELFTRTVESGDALKKQSARLKTGVDDLAEWQFMARRAGIEQESFNENLDTFSKNLGLAKLGSGRLREVLSGNPVFLERLLSTKSTTQAFDVFIRGLSRVKDASEQAALANRAFGDEKILNLTKENLPALRAEYKRLTGSQERFAELSEQEADALDNLSTAAGGARAALFTQLLPAAITITNQLTELVITHRPEIRAWGDTIARTVTSIASTLPSKLQSSIDTLDRLRRAGQPIADLIGGWPKVFAAVGVGILTGPLIGALVQLTSAFTKLGWELYTNPGARLLLGAASPWVLLLGGIATAALITKQRYDDLVPSAERAMRALNHARIDGKDPLTLDQAQQKLMELYQSPGYPQPTSNWAVDSSGLGLSPSGPAGGAVPPRSNAVPQSFVGPSLSIDQASIDAIASAVTAKSAAGPAAVSVDFKNVPSGTRIAPAPGNRLPLNVGISMAESH